MYHPFACQPCHLCRRGRDTLSAHLLVIARRLCAFASFVCIPESLRQLPDRIRYFVGLFSVNREELAWKLDQSCAEMQHPETCGVKRSGCCVFHSLRGCTSLSRLRWGRVSPGGTRSPSPSRSSRQHVASLRTLQHIRRPDFRYT